MLARLVVCLCRQQPQTLAGPVGNTVETADRQADDNSVLTRSALEIIRAGIYQILHESKLFRCQLLQFFGYQKQVLVDHIAGLLLDTDTGVCCGCSFCSCGCHLSNIIQSLSAFGQIKLHAQYCAPRSWAKARAHEVFAYHFRLPRRGEKMAHLIFCYAFA